MLNRSFLGFHLEGRILGQQRLYFQLLTNSRGQLVFLFSLCFSSLHASHRSQLRLLLRGNWGYKGIMDHNKSVITCLFHFRYWSNEFSHITCMNTIIPTAVKISRSTPTTRRQISFDYFSLSPGQNLLPPASTPLSIVCTPLTPVLHTAHRLRSNNSETWRKQLVSIRHAWANR